MQSPIPKPNPARPGSSILSVRKAASLALLGGWLLTGPALSLGPQDAETPYLIPICPNAQAPPGAPPTVRPTIPARPPRPTQGYPGPVVQPSTGPTTEPSSAEPKDQEIVFSQGAGVAAFDPADWDVWWHYNRGAYIDLEGDLARGVVGAANTPLSPGDSPANSSARRPGQRRAGISESLVARSLHPSLVAEFAKQQSFVHEHALMMALARLGPVEGGTDLVPLFTRRLFTGNAWVREGAVVALGVLGTGDAAIALSELVQDTTNGRAYVAKRSVPTRLRSLAAESLGLCAARCSDVGPLQLAIHHLEPILVDRKADTDLRVASAVGLAIAAKPLVARPLEDQVDFDGLTVSVLELFTERRLDHALEAQLPIVLGRCAQHVTPVRREQTAFELVRLLDPKSRTRTETRRAATVALGSVGDSDEDTLDRRIRRTLMLALDDRDRGVRSLAPIALGQVGSRAGTGAGHARAGVGDATGMLMDALRTSKALDQPWIGLGMGVLGNRLREDHLAVDPHAQTEITNLVGKVKVIERTGTVALAAGLVRAPESAAVIRYRYGKMHAFGWRGRMTTALGMLGDASFLKEMRVGTKEGHHDPEWMEGAAIGRALLGDETVVPDLLVTYDSCHCTTSRYATTRALAWVGDVRAVGTLLEVALDPDLAAWDRAYAAEALGWIADRDPRPWKSWLTSDLVHPATPVTLTDPTGGTGLFEHL